MITAFRFQPHVYMHTHKHTRHVLAYVVGFSTNYKYTQIHTHANGKNIDRVLFIHDIKVLCLYCGPSVVFPLHVSLWLRLVLLLSLFPL